MVAQDLLYLIKDQRPDVDKIYLNVKVPFESKYKSLTKGRKKVGLKGIKNPKAFIDYSQTIDDVYENLKGYNSRKKVLIVFDAIKTIDISRYKQI